jgi:hypothetical protein
VAAIGCRTHLTLGITVDLQEHPPFSLSVEGVCEGAHTHARTRSHHDPVTEHFASPVPWSLTIFKICKSLPAR